MPIRVEQRIKSRPKVIQTLQPTQAEPATLGQIRERQKLTYVGGGYRNVAFSGLADPIMIVETDPNAIT